MIGDSETDSYSKTALLIDERREKGRAIDIDHVDRRTDRHRD